MPNLIIGAVRFAPKADKRTLASICPLRAKSDRMRRSKKAQLFDPLVGEQLNRVGHLQAERLRGLQVDDELELGRLQYRQLGGLAALEDDAGINADLTEHVCDAGAVAHQQAGFDHLTIGTTRRHPVPRRQRGKLAAATVEEAIASDQQGVGALTPKGSKSRIDLACGAGVD